MALEDDQNALHEAVAANSSHAQDVTGGAVLTGWLIVSEWMGEDGDRYLAHCRSPMTTSWTARGMMHEVLHGAWPEGD